LNFRSIADLSCTVRKNLYKIPRDVDLIVGIPRSGMLAANMIALYLNLKFCDLHSFINNIPITHGLSRQVRYSALMKPSDARHVLIVDDSVLTGESIDIARKQVAQCGMVAKTTYCAIYAASFSTIYSDIFLEVVELPRIFEWNVLHLPFLEKCCVDIDGVLCLDPTRAYLEYLTKAAPLVIPSYPIGHLVTSRLEKYRKDTEYWLAKHDVEYAKLHMLDLPNSETRRRLGCHASFKAEVYRRQRESILFIESEPHQAMQIMKASGKHVLSFSTQELFCPGFSYPIIERHARHFGKRALRKMFRFAKRLFDYN